MAVLPFTGLVCLTIVMSIIRDLFSLFGSSPGQGERQEITLAPVVTKKVGERTGIGKYDSDIAALTEKWGTLSTGLCIETNLQDLLTICPRERRRIDAYNGLVSLLRDKYEVTLTIKSRKTN